jgi:hypothetical protein
VTLFHLGRKNTNLSTTDVYHLYPSQLAKTESLSPISIFLFCLISLLYSAMIKIPSILLIRVRYKFERFSWPSQELERVLYEANDKSLTTRLGTERPNAGLETLVEASLKVGGLKGSSFRSFKPCSSERTRIEERERRLQWMHLDSACLFHAV